MFLIRMVSLLSVFAAASEISVPAVKYSLVCMVTDTGEEPCILVLRAVVGAVLFTQTPNQISGLSVPLVVKATLISQSYTSDTSITKIPLPLCVMFFAVIVAYAEWISGIHWPSPRGA